MKIAYYMPFKPMDHPNPSGDRIIGAELFSYLQEKGADIEVVSRFRCRWIYLKPHLWFFLLVELLRVVLSCRKNRPDIWLTYHTYYKAPDILGPLCCRILGIPYVVFQGIYSTKRRRSLKTWLGFHLNRRALEKTTCTMTNKKRDRKNLERLLPRERVRHIPPGLHPHLFTFNEAERGRKRDQLNIKDQVVVMTAAMFRPGVKTAGIKRVIESCTELKNQGLNISLLIAGDGVNRSLLEDFAGEQLGQNCRFLGKISRESMGEYYCAADIFAFPGIEESLGMVYLEAQACRLPVVAYADWGAKEAVEDGKSGLLSPAGEPHKFTENIQTLVESSDLRQEMGAAAEKHVRTHHDLEKNYARVMQILNDIVNTSG